jgi:hypothetical protein
MSPVDEIPHQTHICQALAIFAIHQGDCIISGLLFSGVTPRRVLYFTGESHSDLLSSFYHINSNCCSPQKKMMMMMKMLEKYLELDDTWGSLVQYFEIAEILYVWLHFEDLDLV